MRKSVGAGEERSGEGTLGSPLEEGRSNPDGVQERKEMEKKS